jgi:antitoxin ParD1/3/4
MKGKHMNISLTPILEKFIQDKVDNGLYNSASEVVRESLRLMIESDHIKARRIEELNREIEKGMNSGPGRPYDEVFRDLFAKLDKQKE